MSQPTEKHMETAKHIVDGVLLCDLDVLAVARVLSHAEREGMRRAAEIAREQANIDWDDGDGGQYGHGYETACGNIAAEILSEAERTA